MSNDPYSGFQEALAKGCMKRIKELDIVAYIYLVYKQWYYIGEPIVSDQDFDVLEETLRRYAPEHPVLKVVGLIWPTCKCCKGSGDPIHTNQ